ncbi:30S ribosomal protein S27 [Nitrosopumilus sp. PRT-SC01]|nr:30S ribosomal protein S27 [Nitrosopumilus sp. PRT-SC01]
MKKDHIEITEPSSKFCKVNCDEGGEPQVVYSHASTTVACNSCGNTITEPTGSKAKINGKILGSAE